MRWSFSQAFILSPPFRELKNPWGGAGEGEKEEEREKRREGEGGRIQQTPYTLYLDCLHHMLLTVGPEAAEGRMMQTQMLRHQDCSQRAFTAYVEAGQTSVLARHLGCYTRNSPSPLLKFSGL